MVHLGLNSFCNKRILLLQGPVGPFFKLFSDDLKSVGADVYKINFNGGDWFFSQKNSTDYTGSLEEWPRFFVEFIEFHKIDTVILFGDCRAYHRVAHKIAEKKGLEIGIFEEGYVRPDYITFEEFGVNGHSQISRNPDFYRTLKKGECNIPQPSPVGNTFWYAAWWAALYYFFSSLFRLRFCHYRHHRPLNLWEVTYWIRSIWRKWLYKYQESGMHLELTTTMSKKYFLAPLQISTDAQVRVHSTFSSVENFLERIISSFSANAPIDTILVIKHHPLDRGYHNYAVLIRQLSTHYNVDDRVQYIHDQHLPSLLEHARGVVLINSTVGLSAIHHNASLKVCGSAIYDMEGLTYQGELKNFWQDSENYVIDRELYERFICYLVNHKLMNGNFYRRLKSSDLKSGINW